MSQRFKRAERAVAQKLGTTRTPLSGSNSRHTASDTLHPDLFVEVKLRKTPPLWGRLLVVERRARRLGRRPLIVADHLRSGVRLFVTRLDDFIETLAEAVPASGDLYDDFLVEHVPMRRSALFSLWAHVAEHARAEGKRPLVVYKASGRPGELAAWQPAEDRHGSAWPRGPGPSGGEGPRPQDVKRVDTHESREPERRGTVERRVRPNEERLESAGPGRRLAGGRDRARVLETRDRRGAVHLTTRKGVPVRTGLRTAAPWW